MCRPAPLVGLAIGDALGMPFETQPPDSPALLAWDGSYGSSDYHQLGPGQWTDDTQMSCCLASSLVRLGDYDLENVASEYLGWFQSGNCRGIGGSTRRAMERLAAGENPSGIDGATGNGTAMRASPIGCWFRGNEASILQTATLDATITHRSREATDGSTAIALSVSWLLGNGPKQSLVKYLAHYLPVGAMRGAILLRGLPVGPISPYVVDSVAAALWCFLETPDFESAVQTAVRLGGDTDSVAAITGALAGTHYGYESIPAYYLDALEGLSALQDLELRLLR